MLRREDLDEKSRSELLEEARRLGFERPERMTRVELRDEIIRRTVPEHELAQARGLFGVARSMLASVVESGLNLPDAAKLIRGQNSHEIPASNHTPVATVTLAEIYAAQGHRARALRVLDDVLALEPGHEEALRVKAELLGTDSASSPAPSRPEAREALTKEAPPVVEYPATTEYVPGGFVETTGEEIETGRPPVVEPVAEPIAEPIAEAPADERAPALVLSQDHSGLALYWELPRAALLRCSVDEADGRAALRLVGFSATGVSPGRVDETIPLEEVMLVSDSDDLQIGRLSLAGFAAPMAVRAALGWASEDGFLPLTVGRFLEECGADRAARTLAERAARHLS